MRGVDGLTMHTLAAIQACARRLDPTGKPKQHARKHNPAAAGGKRRESSHKGADAFPRATDATHAHSVPSTPADAKPSEAENESQRTFLRKH
jgi:hypothetical protein